MGNNILNTKLAPPYFSCDCIKRYHMYPRLQEALNEGPKVTLVSAPAGYGKTLLIADFLKNENKPYGWVSLDTHDNDPVRFLLHIIRALEISAKVEFEHTKNLLFIMPLPAREVLATSLINEIAHAKNYVLLVLDDYHFITNSYVQAVMSFLIEHLPENFFLFLLTRQEPSLPLSRLRVAGKLMEIGMEELRFSRTEVCRLFYQLLNLRLSRDTTDKIMKTTEGWPVGLRLLSMIVKERKVELLNNLIDHFHGQHRYVFDYFIDEVLCNLPQEVKDFLYKTSVLEYFSASLCEMVTGCADSQRMLLLIERSSLFLIPVDEERQWFRYHPLIAGALKNFLKKNEKAELCQRASQWFELQGNLTMAIHYSFAANDFFGAAKLIELYVPEAFHDGSLALLVHWIEALPKEIVSTHISLLISFSWSLYLMGKGNEATDQLAKLEEKHFAAAAPVDQGRMKSLKSLMAYNRDDQQAIQLAQEALELIPEDEERFVRVSTIINLGRALLRKNKMRESTNVFRVALSQAEKLNNSFLNGIATLYLTRNLNYMGHRQEAISLCEQTIENAARAKQPIYAGIVAIQMGKFYYESNELNKAERYLTQALKKCRFFNVNKMMYAEATLALVQYFQGNSKSAFETINQVRRDDDPVYFPSATFYHASVRAALDWREGRIEAIEQWINLWNLSVNDIPTLQQEFGYLTFIRFLIWQNRIKEAQCLLQKMKKEAIDSGRQSLLINVYILLSLAEKENNREQACLLLQRALQLAVPQKYYQAFVIEGPEIEDMLEKISHTDASYCDLIKQRISRMKGRNTKQNTVRSLGVYNIPDRIATGNFVEMLSNREIDILRLVEAGASNRNIADSLGISLYTVKWHLVNIYSKFGVKRRTEAVKKGKQLKIL